MASLDNQLTCMEYFRDNLGWDDYMCAALVGCIIGESNISPGAINKDEKNGTASSLACNQNTPYGTKTSPWSYGAGLIKWTFTDRKEKAIMLGLGYNKDKTIETIKHSGIESLSLEQQLKMIVAEISRGDYKDNFSEAIIKCKTLKDAVATVYCRYLNGYNSENSIPTDEEIKRLDNNYEIDNNKSEFYKSLKYAEQALQNYHHSIDI